MKKVRKLILSLILLGVTAVTFASTTFAFVFMQSQTEIEEFDIQLECEEGLLISLDGKNFANIISEVDIKKQIAGSVAAFDKRAYYPVTPASTDNNKIAFDEDGNVKFKIQSGNSFVDAQATDYIKFDLWFKPISAKEVKSTYSLKLDSRTYFNSEDVTVNLLNKLTAGDTEYNAGDDLIIDTSNAMRIGTVEENQSSMTIYELPNSNDLGSAAIEGSTDIRHDKTKNAMYTYYNSIFPDAPFTEAAPDSDAYKAIMVSSEDNEITKFAPNAKNEYDAKKITVYIWLEGWDADYFFGIPNVGKNISTKLVFTIVD